VLFLLFGSSGAGKTTALRALAGRADRLALHDFDEVGVPQGADVAWRQATNRRWVARALELEAAGVDLLLASQTPFGELLACLEADRLEAVSGCLLDCDPATRRERLLARGEAWLARVGGSLDRFDRWAEWLLEHARDPGARPEVVTGAGDAAMHWDRWADWRAGDPRWRVRTLDVSRLSVDAVADELLRWVRSERELVRLGRHPLARSSL
jgi:hypothetical protein